MEESVTISLDRYDELKTKEKSAIEAPNRAKYAYEKGVTVIIEYMLNFLRTTNFSSTRTTQEVTKSPFDTFVEFLQYQCRIDIKYHLIGNLVKVTKLEFLSDYRIDWDDFESFVARNVLALGKMGLKK